MSITPIHWLIAAVLAVTAHMAVFTGFELDNSAQIERAAGVNIAVGSISSYVSQSVSQDTSTNEVVETADAEVIDEETPDQIQPDDTVNEVTQTRQTETLDEEKNRQTLEKTAVDTVIKAIAEKNKVSPITKKTIVKTKKPRRKKAIRKKPKSAKRKTRAGSRTIAARRGSGGGGHQNSVSGRADFSNYKGRVRARIARRVARPTGLKGRVVLRFTIVRTGRVTRARIVRSSNVKLNRLALAAVNGSFQAIPPGMPRQITFTVPINFR